MISREIRLKARPDAMPGPEHFELAETEIAPPGPGEVTVRNIWMSVDPYMRGRMREGKSYVAPFQIGTALEGGAVGEVVASNAPDFAVGDHVVSMFGWREAFTCPADAGLRKVDPALAPLQAYLGVLGMPGMTAWAGLLKVGALQEGETVLVSAASGAVGSVVCQIAKAKNCTVAGIAGSDEKCRWLKEKAGVDAAINYRTAGSLSRAIAAALPGGVDVCFENVGGDHLAAALNNM
ncbi:MAG: NADP-dependent oxidoreductase, partial [Alphaproteobacteria bacterium]